MPPLTHNAYDVLNRLATIAYPANSALNITNTYDQTGHGKGIGKLTSVTDAAGTISKSYDERGSITAQARVIGGTTYNTAYSYNAAGRLATLTYPSGAVVTYTRDTAGNISSMAFANTGADSTSVFTGGTYLPFGPPKTIVFNDGITETLTYDHDLNLSTQNAGATGSINLTYAYDNANNLSSVTDAITAANTQTFGYDVINRLTSAVSGTGGYGTQGWTYNANGNLLTTVNGGVTTTFTTTANTNRITAATATGHSWAYGYTTAGNTNSVTMDAGTPTTYSYSVANKLASAVSGTTTESYMYGLGGSRASKTNASGTSKYVYDPAGHLMAEAASGSTTTTEYIYLGSQLVAQYSVAAKKLLSVHTDRIGSPTLVNDKTKTLQWKASYQPYGALQSTSGTFAQNVRLPGQYADSVFGNYHNGARDYNAGTPTNPITDHYLQADPIGLRGGFNPYRYASANPTGRIDPSGLLNQNYEPWEPSAEHEGSRQQLLDRRQAHESLNPSGYSVAGHGNESDMEDTQGNPIVPADLAKTIIDDTINYQAGETVVLYACSTGKGNHSFAQELSTILNTNVVAPDDIFWYSYDSSGITNTGIGPQVYGPTLDGSHYLNTGHWREFHPDSNTNPSTIVPAPK